MYAKLFYYMGITTSSYFYNKAIVAFFFSVRLLTIFNSLRPKIIRLISRCILGYNVKKTSLYVLFKGACFYVELHTPFWVLHLHYYRSNNLEYSHYLRSLHTICSFGNILNEKKWPKPCTFHVFLNTWEFYNMIRLFLIKMFRNRMKQGAVVHVSDMAYGPLIISSV